MPKSLLLIIILCASPLLHATEGEWEYGDASYYASVFNGKRTASGERYNPKKLTAAHRHLPFGTLCEVKRADWVITVRINDRGPRQKNLLIDLSRAAAKALGLTDHGIAEVGLRCAIPQAK